MGKYENILMKEGRFSVYQKPADHLAKANSYSKKEILLLAFIGVERVRRSSGNQAHSQVHPYAKTGQNSSIGLEKVFWNENPDAGVVFEQPHEHLNSAEALSNRELMALGMIGMERIAMRVVGPRNAPPLPRQNGGKFEEIFFRENPHGGYCYQDPITGLNTANHMDNRELLSFLMIGLERLHEVCVHRRF
eukprot:gb/GECH01011363.1/.p1 GENE.gb/GECH01011363.1/~~gb/GECH01011363.1/.p1  ORF type:complete len:191 (+),score=51.58 gb/GECH01011363.1/:1-573(+)